MNWRIPFELQERQNPMVAFTRRPNPIDMTESWVGNDALAIGLYQGTYPGLKLASALAFPVVSVPVAFMGIPTPVSVKRDQLTQQALASITEGATQFLQKVFTLRRVVGTAWAYPSWDAKNGKLFHELIPNASVTDIIRDVNTGETLMVITDEQITVQVGENMQSIIRRKRYFTTNTIKVEYSGNVPAQLSNKVTRNTAGVMPIPFANDVLDNSKRGQSVYTRLLSHLKNYHDVMVKWVDTLAKFNVKWVQEVEKNFDAWINNNPGLGTAGAPEIDVNGVDFIVNKKDTENTKFIFPGGEVSTAYKEIIGIIKTAVVVGSGVPEIVFGEAMTGNHASAEQDMNTLVNTVRDDQTQCKDPLEAYFAACLRLVAGATMQNLDTEFIIAWNDLEVVSQETKAKILQYQADAIQKLTENASIPLESLHGLLVSLYPKVTEPVFETWKASLTDAAKYKQFQTASLTDAVDVVSAWE